MPSLCLFHTINYPLLQWLHVASSVYRYRQVQEAHMFQSKALIFVGTHKSINRSTFLFCHTISAQHRPATLKPFKQHDFSNLLTINGWSFPLLSALQHDECHTVFISFPSLALLSLSYQSSHLSVHYKKVLFHPDRKCPSLAYLVAIGFTFSCHFSTKSRSAEAPPLTECHVMSCLSLKCCSHPLEHLKLVHIFRVVSTAFT